MLLVGANVGIGKSIVAFVPVTLLATLRFAIALIGLWPQFTRTRMRRVKRREWLDLFLQAFFGTFLFTLLMLYGIQRTSAVAAGIIASTIPALVALFAWIFLREQPNTRTLLAIALATLGVAVLAFTDPQATPALGGSGTLAGNLLILGAACCEALYVILSRRLAEQLAPLDVCAYTHGFGLLLMLPVGASAMLHFDYASVPANIWGAVVWYSLSASILSFWLWMKGIRHVPGNFAGICTAMLPVAAALYGVVVLGEQPTFAHGFALVSVLAGIAIAGWQRDKAAAGKRGRRLRA